MLQYAPHRGGHAHASNRTTGVVRRFGWWWLLVLSLGVCLTAVRPLDAASFTLTPQERDAAVRVGKRSITGEDFGGEWRVGGEGPGQVLLVMTPFHHLALAARNSAFKNQELKATDVEALVREQEGMLTLWATLKGGKADFARFYTPVIVSGEREIKARFTQNERTARREDDGSYTARCLYVFPAEGLKANDTLMLIVRDSDDKPAAKFRVDLSAMR